jgi:hypothetical protein
VSLKGVKLVPVDLVVDAFVRGIEDTSLAGKCLRVTPKYGIDVYPPVEGKKIQKRRKGLARLWNKTIDSLFLLGLRALAFYGRRRLEVKSLDFSRVKPVVK